MAEGSLSATHQVSLPHFRVFTRLIALPCGNCFIDKSMETARKMTEHLRLQGKIWFTCPKPTVLKEFVHEFQIRDQPARQRVPHLIPPDTEIISAVPDFAPQGTGVGVRQALAGLYFTPDQGQRRHPCPLRVKSGAYAVPDTARVDSIKADIPDRLRIDSFV